MTKKLEKLKAQQAALAAQIKAEEDALKNRTKIEKMVAKLCSKHPILFSAEAAKVEQAVGDALAEAAIVLEKETQ
ncbi:MAG: hypothetical protein AB1540_15215 [Bdellovibrionota bacterium]